MNVFKGILFVFLNCYLLLMYSSCNSNSNNDVHLNLSDSVGYVGVDVCKNCHYDKYETFIHTGMGMSFGKAEKSKSAANFHNDSIIVDDQKNFNYHPYWENDTLKLKEYRLNGADTIFSRTENVDYIIGSGQHTNSHIINMNGYLHQMPFTYYTQDGRFDLPPGYEHGMNTRLDRKIGLECMSCHNSLPSVVLGSENKFEKIHLGISCERCHGPGALHVEEKMKGNIVDTSIYSDYTIVHPGKISAELQFDICSRCHLQGNTVLVEGKSFFDFKPGMKLADVMDVYVPKYENDDEFIMASHVERLKMSKCFIKSDGALTCLSCHNPHISVTKTNSDVFNATCKSCHDGEFIHDNQKGEDCIDCHMPKSGSIDIPHVSVTDHKISIVTNSKIIKDDSLKKFLGLHCVNNPKPSTHSLMRAYLLQYEKFDQNEDYLDSALFYLNSLPKEKCSIEWVKYYFFKQDYENLIKWFEAESFSFRKKQFNKQSYTNEHAWTWYQIGESYYKLKSWENAEACLSIASKLAPYHLDIQNKFAMSLMRTQKLKKAKEVFEFVILENPKYEKVYPNYGYLLSLLGDHEAAAENYRTALKLNPDLVYAWLNFAAYHLNKGDFSEATKCLKEVLRIDPTNKNAKHILNSMK